MLKSIQILIIYRRILILIQIKSISEALFFARIINDFNLRLPFSQHFSIFKFNDACWIFKYYSDPDPGRVLEGAPDPL